jgi:hypothetical protein
MKEWYEIDDTWSIWGIRTKEEYAQRFVIEGKFHASIPEDILKSYRTAEYLMAHAWYHYPMYDEALKKLSGIYEMAIKLRCKQLGLDLNFINKKGVLEDYKLATLIDKMCTLEPEKELKSRLHRLRKLRNMLAHPDKHSFMGGLGKQGIISLLNVINTIFLDVAIVVEDQKYVASIKQQLLLLYEKFQPTDSKGLFILEWRDKRILITRGEPYISFLSNNTRYTYWVFLPVLTNTYTSIINGKYTLPILLILSDIKITESALTGKDVETGSQVKLIPTTNPADQELLSNHAFDWFERLNEQQRQRYDMVVTREIYDKMDRAEYQYRWS